MSDRLRIGFNARLLHEPALRGWNRYARNLLRELAALGHQLVLYSERPVHPRHLEGLPEEQLTLRPRDGLPYFVWEQLWLPRECGRDRVDVLHSPFHQGLPRYAGCARALTLHDAIDQLYYRPALGWAERASRGHLLTLIHEGLARRGADRFLTVSECSREDLTRYLGIPSDRITVTLEAAEPFFAEARDDATDRKARAAYGLGDQPYFFYVGGWEKRKNLPFLLRAFAAAALPGVELVLAGGGGSPDRIALEELARELGVSDRLRLLGTVSDVELRALYSGALSFVYPSEYEGFGLQLCEAMATGCPVLAARASCLPEVLGPGGETFALDEPGELAARLREIAGGPALREALSRRALARSRDFSWRRTAEGTVEAYREAMSSFAARMRARARG